MKEVMNLGRECVWERGCAEEVGEKRMKGRNEVNIAYSCLKFSKLLRY